MDDESRDELTERQRELLTNARDAIREEPGSYDQRTYGGAAISCQTPACVAGHIVASSRRLRTLLAEQLSQIAQERKISRDAAAARVEQIALEGLELFHYPPLFKASWPIAWRPAEPIAGGRPAAAHEPRRTTECQRSSETASI